jgi:hypothetical protein
MKGVQLFGTLPYSGNHSLSSWRPRRRPFLSTTELRTSQGFSVFRDAPGAIPYLLGNHNTHMRNQRTFESNPTESRLVESHLAIDQRSLCTSFGGLGQGGCAVLNLTGGAGNLQLPLAHAEECAALRSARLHACCITDIISSLLQT